MGATEAISEVVRRVEADYDADIYVYSAGIHFAGYAGLVKSFKKEHPNALLLLATNGGSANAAYKVARLFQNTHDRFLVCIPGVCKSAGTLLAIGANSLLMGQFAELGPLDVQLLERDEIFARKSGLLTHSAFEALKEETFALYEHFLLNIKQRSGDNISFPVASNVAAQMAVGVMEPIFDQMAPNIIGSDYRDLRVAIEYGQRLALYSQNIDGSGVKWLTEEYPSHDFIIDMQEAQKLFHDVQDPTEALWELIGTLSEVVLSESEDPVIDRVSDLEGSGDEKEDQPNADSQNAAERPSGMDGVAERDRGRAVAPRKKRKAPATGGDTTNGKGGGGDEEASA